MNKSALSIHFQPGPAVLGQAAAAHPASAPSLARRVARLRTLAPERVLPELILALEQLPTAELPLPERLALLRKLERSVVRVSAALVRVRDLTDPPPGRPSSLSLEQRLYRGMARASVHLLHELDRGQGFFSEQHADGRVWAIRVALRFFSRGFLYAVATGRPWPPGAWQSLHDLFVYLVMRGTVQIHNEARVADDELDPELIYKRLVMIGLVAERCGHRRIDRSLVRRLRGLAAESRLLASDGFLGEFGLILVDVGRDAPAQVRTSSLDDTFRGWVLRVPEAFRTLIDSLEPVHRRAPAAAR